MKNLEYVLSGTSYVRLASTNICEDPKLVAVINDMLDKILGGKNGKYTHDISILFNAFGEKAFGQRLQVYKDHIKNLHADSGGLQIITLGKTITPELKEEVYEVQANGSDVGMCFDEIPVTLTGLRSERNSTTDRIFDRENFEDYARKTGQNIKKQIEIFKKEESDCRPFLILQGNDVDTYLKWYEYVMDEIPKEDQHRVGGIALGAAALGTGPLEDVQRAFIASQIPWHSEKMHLHILGVGSIRRLIPYLIFQQSGLYKNIEISYDSTSHSRAVETGAFFLNQNVIKYGREYSDIYRILFEEVMSHYDMGTSKDVFYDALNLATKDWLEKYDTLEYWVICRMATIFASIANFMKYLETMIHSKDNILKYSEKIKLGTQYRALYAVNNRSDFDLWYNDQYLGREIKSTPILDTAPNTLEDLFV
tara:strand:+ start:164 stop:1432 length:1269 start_codon:yes stop_codon:yes gene_type:complete